MGTSTGAQVPVPDQESPDNPIKRSRFTGKQGEHVLIVLLKPQSYSLGNEVPSSNSLGGWCYRSESR